MGLKQLEGMLKFTGMPNYIFTMLQFSILYVMLQIKHVLFGIKNIKSPRV